MRTWGSVYKMARCLGSVSAVNRRRSAVEGLNGRRVIGRWMSWLFRVSFG